MKNIWMSMRTPLRWQWLMPTVRCAQPGGHPQPRESVSRLVRKPGKPEQLQVCYEAGPTGYALYWQLSELG
jgi:hypothetical protein